MGLKSRQKRFIDSSVQGKLILRVLAYWVCCMVGIFAVLSVTPIVLSWILTAEHSPTMGQLMLNAWRAFWPSLFASALILPVLLMDVVRVSHRFAGPVYRLRTSMRDLADGKPVSPIKFREGDFWYDMAEEFNRVAARVRDLEPASRQPTPPTKNNTETVAV